MTIGIMDLSPGGGSATFRTLALSQNDPLPTVVAAIRVARDLGPEANVVTIICDSGLRYLSTDVFREPA